MQIKQISIIKMTPKGYQIGTRSIWPVLLEVVGFFFFFFLGGGGGVGLR